MHHQSSYFFLQNREQQPQAISFSQMQHLLLLTEDMKKGDCETQDRRVPQQAQLLEHAKREGEVLNHFLLLASSHR